MSLFVLVLYFVKWQWGKRVLFASVINTIYQSVTLAKKGTSWQRSGKCAICVDMSYFSHFQSLGQHNYHVDIVLPYHSPEIILCCWGRSLCCYVILGCDVFLGNN